MTLWADKSGNGFDGVPASGGVGGPSTGTRTINSLNVLDFVPEDGLNLFGTIRSTLQAAGAAEMFIVARNDHDPAASVNDSGHVIQLSGDTQVSHLPYTDGVVYEGFGTTARKTTGNPSASLTSPFIYNVRSASGSYVTEFNGAAHFSTATNTPGFTGFGFYIGYASANTRRYDGVIGEILIFDNVLSASDRAAIEAYLSDKWGISV